MKTLFLLLLLTAAANATITRSPTADGGATCSGHPCKFVHTCASATCNSTEVNQVSTALAAAEFQRGDLMCLQAGRTYPLTASYTAIFKATGSGYSYIASSASEACDASAPFPLPPSGVRITPKYQALMPTLDISMSGTQVPAIDVTATTTNHAIGWKFLGLFIQSNQPNVWTSTATDTARSMIQMGDTGGTGGAITNISQQSDDIHLERSVLTGVWNKQARQWVQSDCRNCSVKDNYMQKIGNQGQQIVGIGMKQVDTLLVENNYADGGTETFMTGGDVVTAADARFPHNFTIPTNLIVKRNAFMAWPQFYKVTGGWSEVGEYWRGRVIWATGTNNAFMAQGTGSATGCTEPTWNTGARGNISTDGCGGQWAFLSAGSSISRQKANILELKACSTCDIANNFLKDSWSNTQFGYCVSMKPESNATAFHTGWYGITEDVTFRNNYVTDCGIALTIQGASTHGDGVINDLTFHNNLWTDTNKYAAGASYQWGIQATDNFTFTNNTHIWNPGTASGGTTQAQYWRPMWPDIRTDTVNATTDQFFMNGWEMATTDEWKFHYVTPGSPLTGFPAEGTSVWPVNITNASGDTTFQLSLTQGGAAINFTGGTSQLSLKPAAVYDGANLIFRNNLMGSRTFTNFVDSAHPDGNKRNGTLGISTAHPSPTWTNNIMQGANAFGAANTEAVYPDGNFNPAYTAVGFTRYTDGAYSSNDFRLQPASTYKRGGHDGTDIGADHNQLSLVLGLSVVTTDRHATFRYRLTPPEQNTVCSFEVSADRDFSTSIADLNPAAYVLPDLDNKVAAIGSLRTFVVGTNVSLTASTTYYYRMHCGGAFKWGTFATKSAKSSTTSQTFRYPSPGSESLFWGYAVASGSITSPTEATPSCASGRCAATITADRGKTVFYRIGASGPVRTTVVQ
jgi:hypothetical protein